jgi:hypothetical protein
VKSILAYSPDSMVFVNDMGVADEIRALPIHHFLEGIFDSGYTQSHFTTPLILGYSPGYKAGLIEDKKRGWNTTDAWWKTWDSDADVFEDVKDKLRSGCLYYAYDLPEINLTLTTGQGILSWMFPITPRELYGGTIVGDERVITMHNGSYSFGGSSGSVVRHAVGASCVCFGAGGRQVGDGQEVRATTRFEPTEGRRSRAVHSCVVPTSGACVLVPAMPTATETQMHLKAPRKTDDRDDVPETATLLQLTPPPIPLPRLRINVSGVSVSGISSGADFAVYFRCGFGCLVDFIYSRKLEIESKNEVLSTNLYSTSASLTQRR